VIFRFVHITIRPKKNDISRSVDDVLAVPRPIRRHLSDASDTVNAEGVHRGDPHSWTRVAYVAVVFCNARGLTRHRIRRVTEGPKEQRAPYPRTARIARIFILDL